MKATFQNYLDHAKSIENDHEKLIFSISVLRSLLQTSLVSAFEVIRLKTPSEDVGLAEMIKLFLRPADGMSVMAFNSLVPTIRTYVLRDYLLGWFEPTQEIENPLSGRLKEWVEFRNSRPAHGVVDAIIAKEWAQKTIELMEDCLIVFARTLPSPNDRGELVLSKEFGNQVLQTPLVIDQDPLVVMSITARKGIWKLKAQRLSVDSSNEVVFELPNDNVFNLADMELTGRYELTDIVTGEGECSLYHNVPIRQTDTFEGRAEELGLLADWLNDEDSRYCLVYGDGGYGKTTLVLELLNQVLDGHLEIKDPLPEIITYHTAKMTRWTDTGLVHLTGVSPVMDECLRDLIRLFEPVLPPDWYAVSGKRLVDKVVSKLKEEKYDRNDVLLIIDNTETLATSPEEVKDLGLFFKSIGKLIGRVIITSRRREFVEATPILVGGLSEAEAVRLLERLASELGAKAIQQAGQAKLRRVSTKLMHKPVLLETLVRYIARTDQGIDAAMENVYSKSSEELLEFLYEDAWMRMNDLQRMVFFVLVHLSSPLEQFTISRSCQEVGIQHTEFQAGLEETHFSAVTDYGQTYTLELVSLATTFFLQQFNKLRHSEKLDIKKIARKVDSSARERQRVEKAYKTDRVAGAFRSDYAKAAKVHVDNGDLKSAREFYELAIADDPLNSSLHDRYALFLLNRQGDTKYALEISKRAVELDEKNNDAVVGLALVHYRRNNIEEGDKQIDVLSKRDGRSQSFCLLRKAIARYHIAKADSNLDRSIRLLQESADFLDNAERKVKNNFGYEAKTYQDIVRYQTYAASDLATQRGRKTRRANLRK